MAKKKKMKQLLFVYNTESKLKYAFEIKTKKMETSKWEPVNRVINGLIPKKIGVKKRYI